MNTRSNYRAGALRAMTVCMVLARALGTTVRMKSRSLALGAIVGVMLPTLVNLPRNLWVVTGVDDVLEQISCDLALIRELAHLRTGVEAAEPLVATRPVVPDYAVRHLDPHGVHSGLPELHR